MITLQEIAVFNSLYGSKVAWLTNKIIPLFIGGDHKRSGYVQYVPVIIANVPCTYYVQTWFILNHQKLFKGKARPSPKKQIEIRDRITSKSIEKH